MCVNSASTVLRGAGDNRGCKTNNVFLSWERPVYSTIVGLDHLIEYKFNALSDDLKQEVLDFIDFLITKKGHKKSSEKFNFFWEGGLSDLNTKYNSVDLQHQSMEWR